MNILELAQELHLNPTRTASTKGGEYKSGCPECQMGTDRFCIWPNQGESGRYWCRVCESKGDGIQFCRDFLGMTFKQACQKVQVQRILRDRVFSTNPFKTTKFTPKVSQQVDGKWQHEAEGFIASSHKQLIGDSVALVHLFQRGLSLDTISKFKLGWNARDLFDERVKWGLAPLIKDNGCPRKQWLPRGIVIPSYERGKLNKIKIRRSDWHEEDRFPKYVEVAGSRQMLSIYGDITKPVVIVESELDAILIQQHAAHLVCGLALGGVSKKPDHDLHEWLRQKSLILLSLDYDEAGRVKNQFWMALYPNLRPWPSPVGKSPGDAAQIFKVDILSWIKAGLSVS